MKAMSFLFNILFCKSGLGLLTVLIVHFFIPTKSVARVVIGLSTKIIPNEPNQMVTINANETVIIDKSVEVGPIMIQAGGELHCPANSASIILRTTSIMVDGLFECGTTQVPFNGHLQLLLKHDGSLLPTTNDFKAPNAFSNIRKMVPAGYRSIMVDSGGVVNFNGAVDRLQYTKLASSAQKGDSAILVDKAGGWQIGDTIVIAPTGYGYSEFDRRIIIAKVYDSGLQKFKLSLNAPLTFAHNGEIHNISVPATTGPANLPAKLVSLDDRAEVAILDRHISISADTRDLDPNNKHLSTAPFLGGHMMGMAGSKMYITGVEFSLMGQMGILGRYPFHWHLAGNVAGQYIRFSSIHDSFQRCVVIHGTNNAIVSSNTCFSHFGHGFFLENGTEQGNSIVNNLGMFTQRPPVGREILQSDINDIQIQRFRGPSTFWISNPSNRVENNIASGYFGTGFWNSFCSHGPCLTNFGSQAVLNTLAFNSNTAHSGPVGINWDGAPATLSANNPRNPSDFVVDSSHYRPLNTPTFNNLLIYKNSLTGIYFRGDTVIFENALAADNGWSLFFAYNQIVKNSTIIGRSPGFTKSDEDFLFSHTPFSLTKFNGIVLYDGPFELDSVRFIGFSPTKITRVVPAVGGGTTTLDITPDPFFSIGGAHHYSNAARRIQFFPSNPYRRVHMAVPLGWVDNSTSNSLRDIDGSITGRAGTLILPDVPFNRGPQCVSWGETGALVCDSTARLNWFFFSGKSSSNFIPFYAQRISPDKVRSSSLDMINRLESEGLSATSGLPITTETLNNIAQKVPSHFNNKLGVQNDGSAYTVLFRSEDMAADPIEFGQGPGTLGVSYVAQPGSEISPILTLSGRGSNCRLVSPPPGIARGAELVTPPAVKLSNITLLKDYQGSSYFSDSESFSFKIKARSSIVAPPNDTLNFFELYSTQSRNLINSPAPQSRVKQIGTTTQNFEIVCDAPVPNVIGNVDTAGATDSVAGWACDYGKSDSLMVHFYVGGKPGQGQFMGATKANIMSETPVAIRCGTGGRAYRFNYKIPASFLSGNKGQIVYSYGISLSGKPNNMLLSNLTNPPKVK